jgi:hypothetical protein
LLAWSTTALLPTMSRRLSVRCPILEIAPRRLHSQDRAPICLDRHCIPWRRRNVFRRRTRHSRAVGIYPATRVAGDANGISISGRSMQTLKVMARRFHRDGLRTENIISIP